MSTLYSLIQRSKKLIWTLLQDWQWSKKRGRRSRFHVWSTKSEYALHSVSFQELSCRYLMAQG